MKKNPFPEEELLKQLPLEQPSRDLVRDALDGVARKRKKIFYRKVLKVAAMVIFTMTVCWAIQIRRIRQFQPSQALHQAPIFPMQELGTGSRTSNNISPKPDHQPIRPS